MHPFLDDLPFLFGFALVAVCIWLLWLIDRDERQHHPDYDDKEDLP